MFDHPPKDRHYENVQDFRKHFDEYNVQGLTFPISPAQVPHFE
jgi:hypothetical protein